MNKYYFVKVSKYRNIPKIFLLFVAGCIVISSILFGLYILTSTLQNNKTSGKITEEPQRIKENDHLSIINDFLKQRENMALSKLGEILFLNATLPKKRDKLLKILIWQDGVFLERRHVKFFTKKIHDPFSDCSVNNCEVTYDSEVLDSADGVVFFLQRLKGLASLPDPLRIRPEGQRWIFLTDESPLNIFLYRKENRWENYSGIFNWSMSYKMQADIPVPNGRTVPLTESFEMIGNNETVETIKMIIPNNNVKQRGTLLSAMLTNCESDSPKMDYIQELQQHMDVDIYGSCGDKLKTVPNSCAGHFLSDCEHLAKYHFYLSVENSNCDQYMTEKLFWNSYSKGAVPIIMGPFPKNCKMLLPPNSYLHIKDFPRPKDLANRLAHINDTWNKEYFELHKWRNDFAVLNEHGYFGTRSFHYCRICEALNYNNPDSKVYNDLSLYLSPEDNCEDD